MKAIKRALFSLAALAILVSPAAAAEREICERGAVMEKLGQRPPAGSGVFLFWIELTFRTHAGQHMTFKEIYMGETQPFPAPGAVCTVCYHVGKYDGVVMPVSNLVNSITCGADKRSY